MDRTTPTGQVDPVFQAIRLATAVHDGQMDKGGEPYIFHPMRLANCFPGDPHAQICALLHDVVEDSYNRSTGEITEFDILKHFGLEVALTVGALTRRRKGMLFLEDTRVAYAEGRSSAPFRQVLAETDETYLEQYIPRLVGHAGARKIKKADLLDNLSAKRVRADVGNVRYRKALNLIDGYTKRQQSAVG